MEEKKKFGFQKKVVDAVTKTPKAENIEVKESEIVTEEVQKNETPQTPTVTLTIDELKAWVAALDQIIHV